MVVPSKHLITAGCSFTAGGLGGCPPVSVDNPGGNSFVADVDRLASTPQRWPDFLSLQLGSTTLVNLAAGGHGNLLTAYAVKSLLEKYDYSREDTLIVFNITESSRFDIPCKFLLPDKSKDIPWSEDILDASFLNRHTDFFDKIQNRFIGPDLSGRYTSSYFDMFLHWLSINGYRYYFMLMTERILQNLYFKKVIEKFSDHMILMPGATGMMEYCLQNKLVVSAHDWHPSVDGHKSISSIVYDYLRLISSDIKKP
jgi:hypothetical protein